MAQPVADGVGTMHTSQPAYRTLIGPTRVTMVG